MHPNNADGFLRSSMTNPEVVNIWELIMSAIIMRNKRSKVNFRSSWFFLLKEEFFL